MDKGGGEEVICSGLQLPIASQPSGLPKSVIDSACVEPTSPYDSRPSWYRGLQNWIHSPYMHE